MGREVPIMNRRKAKRTAFLPFPVSRKVLITTVMMNYQCAIEKLGSFQNQKPERRRQRMKRRSLNEAGTDAENATGDIVNSFYCLGIKKKIPQIKSSHAIGMGFQFLQVD